MRSASGVRGKPDADFWILGAIATVISVAAFFYYFHNGSLLLYGDAVAHMNIARRTIDSRTPGPLQLGTVWLPLPHIVMVPLVAFTWMWQTGVGGAIPSMIAYVASVLGVFRLVRNGLQRGFGMERESRVAAWFAALTLAANPNLIYMQTTAMTEPLYLAFFIWATVYLADFVFDLRDGRDEAAQRALVRSGFFLFLGMVTRYDGWFAGATYGIAGTLVIAFAMHGRGERWTNLLRDVKWRRAFAGFALWLIITPAIWFPWNWLGFEDPMAFATGPYSARGIEQRTRKPDQPHHPGWDNPRIATLYFVKSAKLNMAGGNGEQRAWIWFAVLGSVLCLLWSRRLWMWLLLWVPMPFYALSIAHGGVPIFLPEWYPFSYYNTRYGTQLFPAIVVFSALLLFFLLVKVEERRWQVRLAILAFAFVASTYIFLWRQTPVVLREAIINARTRVAFETKLAAELVKLRPDASILLYTGEHGGALQRLGMPLKRTLNEGNRKAWKKALPDPASAADYVVATQGDDVAAAVAKHPEGLEKVAEVASEGQNPATIYRSSRAMHPASNRWSRAEVNVALYNPPETVDFLRHIWQLSGSSSFIANSMLQLLLAAVLGGAIGLERELRHRPSGLRTNLFICFGSAMFTILSAKLAGEFTGDHTRIAAQIIPGIGFIGAGSIIHARSGITGLTSAATLFVVASIGMACGGGLYFPAIFATVMILLCLVVLGRVEERFSLKTFVTGYEVTGKDAETVIGAINTVLEDEHKLMQTVSVGKVNDKSKVQFTVEGTRREHESLQARLRLLPEAEHLHTFLISEYE